MQTFSASRFFACLKTTLPFENDSANITHYCALRRNSVSPQDRFLEAWFSLLALPAKIHSFRPHSLALLRSFGKCARRILEVTLGKSVILPRSITLYSMCPQHLNVCDAPLCGCMSKHFTCPLVACGLRAHFTFLPFKAKTFHFCAAIYVRLPLTYICAKISRSAQGHTFVY